MLLEVCLLEGSGVAISRVRSPLIWLISIVTLLITLLITNHEPPSNSHFSLKYHHSIGESNLKPG